MNAQEIIHRRAFMKAATRAYSLECRTAIYCRSQNQDISLNIHELFILEPY